MPMNAGSPSLGPGGTRYNTGMPTRSVLSAGPGGLQDLPRVLQAAEGFPTVVEALRAGRAATVDGAWNSAAALVAAALGQEAPQTLLIVLAHPRDVDFWTEDLTSFTGRRPV